MNRAPVQVSAREAAAAFGRIGVLSFGGPAAQISLMHRVLVDEKGWLSEQEFLDALSFCMLLPGPEAMQLATYCGWRLHGVRGGLVAGALFVLPGAAVIFALASLYVAFGDVPAVDALFLGVQAAVLAIVAEALVKVARRALTGPAHVALAVAAFVCIFVLDLPFPLIVLAAGLLGAMLAGAAEGEAVPVAVPWQATARTAGLGLAAWLGPLAMLWLVAGETILPQIGAYFSVLAVVTFGGAYAVLAYMAQEVVGTLGWLTAEQMIDGLGLAETTPGPLILVTQFVAFLAGFGAGGWGMAVAAALVALWVTFVPCYLWIFTGAPYLDAISARPRLRAALGGITAAVVGVIANLSLWFALHVLFGDVTRETWGVIGVWWPDLATLDWRAAALAVLAAALLFGTRAGLGPVLVVSALGGLALSAI